VCCAARSGAERAVTHVAAACAALAVLLAPPSHVLAAPEQELLIEDVPSALSAGDGAPLGGESRSSKLRGANSKAISSCASKCITTCTRGCVAASCLRELCAALHRRAGGSRLSAPLASPRRGPGAPGLGPLSQRGELIVFKQGEALRYRTA
jgi:hypothetical protein